MQPPLHRTLAVSLALCAMLVRALLPAGWMPNPTAFADASPFIICSGEESHAGAMPMAGMDMAGMDMSAMAMEGAMHMGGKSPSNSAGERTHAPCAFSAVAHLAPPAHAPALASAPTYAGHEAFFRGTDFEVAAVPHRPQAARAPPAFS